MSIYFSNINTKEHHHGTVLSMCMKPITGYKNVECLAPTKELVYGHKYQGKSNEWYEQGYRKLLAQRSAAVRSFINGLNIERDYTLLCYCAEGKFCHRQLLAKWFKSYRPELEIILH